MYFFANLPKTTTTTKKNTTITSIILQNNIANNTFPVFLKLELWTGEPNGWFESCKLSKTQMACLKYSEGENAGQLIN